LTAVRQSKAHFCVLTCDWLTLPAGKLIAAVCHGPAGLVKAKGSDGLPLVNDRQVTGFTNSEEEAVGKTKVRGDDAHAPDEGGGGLMMCEKNGVTLQMKATSYLKHCLTRKTRPDLL
jgi:putative intracellular protease/amidase